MVMMMLTLSALQGTDAKLALSPALQGRKANMRRQWTLIRKLLSADTLRSYQIHKNSKCTKTKLAKYKNKQNTRANLKNTLKTKLAKYKNTKLAKYPNSSQINKNKTTAMDDSALKESI